MHFYQMALGITRHAPSSIPYWLYLSILGARALNPFLQVGYFKVRLRCVSIQASGSSLNSLHCPIHTGDFRYRGICGNHSLVRRLIRFKSFRLISFVLSFYLSTFSCSFILRKQKANLTKAGMTIIHVFKPSLGTM